MAAQLKDTLATPSTPTTEILFILQYRPLQSPMQTAFSALPPLDFPCSFLTGTHPDLINTNKHQILANRCTQFLDEKQAFESEADDGW